MDSAFMERLKRRPGGRIRARTKNMRPEAAGTEAAGQDPFLLLVSVQTGVFLPGQ